MHETILLYTQNRHISSTNYFDKCPLDLAIQNIIKSVAIKVCAENHLTCPLKITHVTVKTTHFYSKRSVIVQMKLVSCMHVAY